MDGSGAYYASRTELLEWLNTVLPESAASQLGLAKVEKCKSGIPYAILLAEIYPNLRGVISKRLKGASAGIISMIATGNPNDANYGVQKEVTEYDSHHNMKMIQDILSRNHISRHIEVDRIAKGHLSSNLEFLQWFRKFSADYGISAQRCYGDGADETMDHHQGEDNLMDDHHQYDDQHNTSAGLDAGPMLSNRSPQQYNSNNGGASTDRSLHSNSGHAAAMMAESASSIHTNNTAATGNSTNRSVVSSTTGRTARDSDHHHGVMGATRPRGSGAVGTATSSSSASAAPQQRSTSGSRLNSHLKDQLASNVNARNSAGVSNTASSSRVGVGGRTSATASGGTALRTVSPRHNLTSAGGSSSNLLSAANSPQNKSSIGLGLQQRSPSQQSLRKEGGGGSSTTSTPAANLLPQRKSGNVSSNNSAAIPAQHRSNSGRRVPVVGTTNTSSPQKAGSVGVTSARPKQQQTAATQQQHHHRDPHHHNATNNNDGLSGTETDNEFLSSSTLSSSRQHQHVTATSATATAAGAGSPSTFTRTLGQATLTSSPQNPASAAASIANTSAASGAPSAPNSRYGSAADLKGAAASQSSRHHTETTAPIVATPTPSTSSLAAPHTANPTTRHLRSVSTGAGNSSRSTAADQQRSSAKQAIAIDEGDLVSPQRTVVQPTMEASSLSPPSAQTTAKLLATARQLQQQQNGNASNSSTSNVVEVSLKTSSPRYGGNTNANNSLAASPEVTGPRLQHTSQSRGPSVAQQNNGGGVAAAASTSSLASAAAARGTTRGGGATTADSATELLTAQLQEVTNERDFYYDKLRLIEAIVAKETNTLVSASMLSSGSEGGGQQQQMLFLLENLRGVLISADNEV